MRLVSVLVFLSHFVLAQQHSDDVGGRGLETMQSKGQLPPLQYSIGGRWTDMLPELPPLTQGDESASPALIDALSTRAGGTPDRTAVEIHSQQSSTEPRYLFCFLPREEAGLVTQMRHLVDCAVLAKTLKRTMLSPLIIASGMDPKVWPRFWDELVDFDKLASYVGGLGWVCGRRAKAAVGDGKNVSAVLDLYGPESGGVPSWLQDYLSKNLGFAGIKKRKHGASENTKSIGNVNQQTLFVVWTPEESRGGNSRRAAETALSLLEPVPWLGKILRIMKTELFGRSETRYLTMTIVRGADLSRCVSKVYQYYRPKADLLVSDPEPEFDHLMQIMMQCYTADSDIDAVVTSIQNKFGPMKVRIFEFTCLQHFTQVDSCIYLPNMRFDFIA